ncbi:MAG: FixH family protein [Bacteroidetes bacterium]|nr:FixH family protein [Bacteroidota bacterium]MCH8523313.1 FixH family protein [Balneolales bacterium]
MKLNFKEGWQWPLGIIIAYLIFMGGTLAFVFSTFSVKNDLVTDNYYQKTLVFQQQIDAESNALSLRNPLRWELTPASVTLFYPEELMDAGIQGEIVMYRPSDASLDFSVPVQFDQEGVQVLPLAGLQRGVWKMEVSWMSAETAYYSTGNLYLQ